MIALHAVLAAFASLASAAVLPRATSASYKLKTHVISGNQTLDGLYIQPIHTGAGLNSVGLTSNATASPVGSITDGTYQTFVLGQFPYHFDMTNAAPVYPSEAHVPTAALPPAGYNYVGLNVGDGSAGFSVAAASNNLVWAEPLFQSFAACYIQYAAPTVQLLWRNSTAGAPSGRCAEVELKVVYE